MARTGGISVRRTRREGKGITALVLPELRAAAHVAVDRATREAKRETQLKIRSVGLGRLANAVGDTSSLRKRRTNQPRAWGAIFARGGEGGRGEQALIAYSQGASITPVNGRQWLAFATDKIPKRAGRFKMTPQRYRQAGYTRSIGKLVFVARTSKEALLIVKKVEVSKRTGRATRQTGRPRRGAQKEKFIVAFVLIRFTRRAARFSQDQIMQHNLDNVPKYVSEYQNRMTAR